MGDVKVAADELFAPLQDEVAEIEKSSFRKRILRACRAGPELPEGP